jgi:hypothetical protein
VLKKKNNKKKLVTLLCKYGSLWAVRFVDFTHQIRSRFLCCERRQDELQCSEMWPCTVMHFFCTAYSFHFLKFLRHLNRAKQSTKMHDMESYMFYVYYPARIRSSNLGQRSQNIADNLVTYYSSLGTKISIKSKQYSKSDKYGEGSQFKPLLSPLAYHRNWKGSVSPHFHPVP